MKKKLNCILLIDDDESANFVHKIVIKKANCAEKVVVAENGLVAMEYLQSLENGQHPRPDLIFLDINMPGMDGWEFIEEYKKLGDHLRGKVILLMLTTSFNPDDLEKAKSIEEIKDYKNKPLSPLMLTEILEKYFPEAA